MQGNNIVDQYLKFVRIGVRLSRRSSAKTPILPTGPRTAPFFCDEPVRTAGFNSLVPEAIEPAPLTRGLLRRAG